MLKRVLKNYAYTAADNPAFQNIDMYLVGNNPRSSKIPSSVDFVGQDPKLYLKYMKQKNNNWELIPIDQQKKKKDGSSLKLALVRHN